MSSAQRPDGWKTDAPGTHRCRGRIVFHADDFGMNRAVTDGILRGFQHGLITATSLLANAPEAARAMQEWERLRHIHSAGHLPSRNMRRELDEPESAFELGIHLNLTQGRPLTRSYPPELLNDDGCFGGVGRLFASFRRRRPSLERQIFAELDAQIEFLRDHGHRPTHLNGHQYIELLPGLRPAVRELLVRHQIPALRVAREQGLLRSTLLYDFRPSNWCLGHVKRFYAGRLHDEARGWGVSSPHRFYGTSHAARINLDVMRRFLRSAAGATLIEVGVHPATDSSKDSTAHDGRAASTPAATNAQHVGWHDPLAALRPQELGMLTSPLLVELVQEFGLSLGRLNHAHTEAVVRAA
ncbi:MAG TPA: ChbG/HpnK family deacetylase [Planctomycetaceae bacterium]|jgi:predicted glycoside hydrolase/deacetylase ChbG (UPF0249 family)|nr:ChbG/HpnK family deacetylase [Planctomycetaceae bacterium]